jgi:MoxR-like ATPase
MTTLEQIVKLQQEMGKSIIGQEHIVQRLVVGLLANGNLLVEGLPGLAKTRAVKALSKHIDSDFSRIQFTPDLLPSDVTGSESMYEEGGAYKFRFEPGPIFGNIILADEINRAPAKVQSAMLEAMEERQITVAGVSHKLPDLFMVMATQNPIEQEGTYPLPEAQMDRFLMHVHIDYPSEEAELQVLELVRSEKSAAKKEEEFKLEQSVIFEARGEINKVRSSEAIDRYIIDLVFATRYPQRYSEELASYIDVGASPRASIALDTCARCVAWLAGRDFVNPEDVRSIIHDVLRHRIALSYEALAKRKTTDDIISMIVQQVAIGA